MNINTIPKNELGKNGILRDPSATLPPLLTDIFTCAAENGLQVEGLTVSPIHGTNGNVEYLAIYHHSDVSTQSDKTAWDDMIADALMSQPEL